MFIRKVTKKVKQKKYTQLQLIESIRTSSGPRQRIVLNLGNVNLNEAHWKDLANAIEDILNNQKRLFESGAQINALAKRYAQKITQRRFKRAEDRQKEGEGANGGYEKVEVDSVCTSDARSIGAEHIVLNQMKEYKFEKILKGQGFSYEQIIYAKMLVAGRMVHPGSERETARWMEENSGISELLKTGVRVYDKALHRVAVLLWENYRDIENELRIQARDVFSLKESIILYDLTNSYFEGSKRDSKITGFRRSKDRRNDRPLVALALTVDDEGFPKQSKILKGDVTESETFKEMLDELDKDRGLFGPEKTIVIDAGIATEDNINLIKERKNFKYVVVSRKREFKDVDWAGSPEDVLNLKDNKTKLRIRLVRTEDESYLLCHSEAKSVKETSILNRKMRKFEEEVKYLGNKLHSKGGLKKYDKVLEKIGRLKEHYKVGQLYDIKVEEKDGKALKVELNKNRKGEEKELTSGRYILRTNRNDLSGEEISKIHRSLAMVEDSFWEMKGELGLRPNYHHEDVPTVAHINITVLAYHILCGILKKLQNSGIFYNWNSIRNVLSTHVRVTTTMNTDDYHVLHIRTNTIPNAKQDMIYDALKIRKNPLSRVVMRARLKNVVPKTQSKNS